MPKDTDTCPHNIPNDKDCPFCNAIETLNNIAEAINQWIEIAVPAVIDLYETIKPGLELFERWNSPREQFRRACQIARIDNRLNKLDTQQNWDTEYWKLNSLYIKLTEETDEKYIEAAQSLISGSNT